MAGSTLADEEALQAVKAYWDSVKDFTSVCGALLSGKLKGPQAQPYAVAMSQAGPTPMKFYALANRGSPYQDYRKITITGYGSREHMKALAQACAARLAWLPRDGMTLPTWPEGVSFCSLVPLADPHLEEDQTSKAGKEVWKLTAEYELWTTRQIQ